MTTFPPSDEGLIRVRYVPGESAPGAAPWREVYVLPVNGDSERVISPERRVGWCVAFHRALVGRIGDGAPPVVTGRYLDGAAVPANRVAIQYVPASVLAQSAVGALGVSGAFIVMLPSGLAGPETEVIRDGLANLSHVRSRWADLPLRMRDVVFDAAAFWALPASDMARLWSPMPAAVPEVVKQRGTWTFDDAILLSLGFVWRDRLGLVERGAKGYRDLVSQVREHGADVLWHRRLTRAPEAYAHRMPHSMVAQPYTAQITTGDLSDDMTLVAIGQSRHLGGGLLVPIDMPAELAHTVLRRPR